MPSFGDLAIALTLAAVASEEQQRSQLGQRGHPALRTADHVERGNVELAGSRESKWLATSKPLLLESFLSLWEEPSPNDQEEAK